MKEQSIGLCTVQLIRVPEETPQPRPKKVGQLWWVASATEVAIQNLKVGEDVTRQQCSEYGFRGTKTRVKIHCIQHFCKYLCECQLIKSSRDTIYDHQVSKNSMKDHGGADRRIYCVDKPSYPAFCLAMGR